MKMKPYWRLCNTGASDGFYNMALDEAILKSLKESHGQTTVRIYGWHPPAISVGYGQNIHRDIDIERCNKSRIPIVRRLTGGRAVLHDQEVTYSVAAPESDPRIGRSTQETYNRIGRALVRGLRHLGVGAELQRLSKGSGQTPSCFSSTGRYEVVVGGKKLIGSAQRRLSGAILQHGSLLTGSGYRNLSRFLPTDRREAAERSMNSVTTLSEILGDEPSFAQIATALHLGFEEAFGCQLIEGELSEEELALTQRLKIERYQRDEWNLHRSTSQPK
jgi:lipoate-protein ligase A